MLDVTTSFVFSCAVLGALGALWLVVAQTYPSIKAARYWAAAALVTGAGVAIFVLFARSAGPTSLVAGNTVLVVGISLAWAGVRRFYRRPMPTAPCAAVAAATLIGLILSTLVFHSPLVRGVVVSLAQGSLMSVIGLELLRGNNSSRALGSSIAGWALIACVMLHAVRIAMIASGHPQMVVVSATAIQAPMVLEFAFLTLIFHFALLLMAVEQLQDELERLAGTDSLTGLANRRFFLAQGERECSRAMRSGRPFALLMMDVDCFKSINDTYGHAAGDAILKAFVDAVASCLRPTDILARYGGEEFCVLLPDTGAPVAVAVAERIRRALRERALPWRDTLISVTVSIGVAEWTTDVGSDLACLVAMADEALYRAKQSGRDRVVLSDLKAVAGETL